MINERTRRDIDVLAWTFISSFISHALARFVVSTFERESRPVRVSL